MRGGRVKYRQWEIWDVEWPHEDDPEGSVKVRPALIVSPTRINDGSEGVWFVKISGVDRPLPSKLRLDASDPEFPSTGLRKSSFFYVRNIKLLPKDAIRSRRGCAGPNTTALIDELIREAFGHSVRESPPPKA